jgi:hypothetical protein
VLSNDFIIGVDRDQNYLSLGIVRQCVEMPLVAFNDRRPRKTQGFLPFRLGGRKPEEAVRA